MEISITTCLAGLSIVACLRSCSRAILVTSSKESRMDGISAVNDRPSLLTLWAGATALAYGQANGSDFLMLSASSLNLIGVMLTEASARGLAFTPKAVASSIGGGRKND